jgi:hypothetical protein
MPATPRLGDHVFSIEDCASASATCRGERPRVVVLTHVCESLHLFPGMHWGLEHSASHYLDLTNAILGFTLFPTGYLLQALRNRP